MRTLADIFQSARSVTLGLAVALLATVSGRSASTVAPDFALPRWDSKETVKLADFAGQIVVLDFFAYWCGPCRKASAEVEAGIEKFYAEKNGNPQGIPVRVIGVNIEADNPKLTAEFIKDAGMQFVVSDFSGALLAKFGGAATPFLVVLDGTRSPKERAEFRVVYQRAGFEGTKKLRAIIDAIKPPASASGRAGEVRAEATSAPVTHRPEVDFETLRSSDIQLTSVAGRYGQKRGGTDWSVSYTHSSINADYEPYRLFDFLGFSQKIREAYDGGQVAVRQTLGDSLTALVSGGVYTGFTDYRSAWLATYYQQQVSFFPDYTLPDPHGFNFGTGLRWEYLPATGFLEADFAYANDTIAPGYEFDPGSGTLLRGRAVLHTYSPTLKLENILTSRIRSLQEFQLTVTSGRQPRYSYRGSVNVALGERWVWRTTGGYTKEAPTLEAWFVGGTLEFAVAPRWLLSVAGRYYRDTGEIENSRLISSAAPGLETREVGLGVRYVGAHSSFKLFIAPHQATYDPVSLGTRPFTNLYKDRTWGVVQLAWAAEF